MGLERYRQKRDFRRTPEPAGNAGKPRSGGLSFVVQKHAASRLHYDFRLELNGVLLSWAVPKGPSLDPNEKRLAMHVEDHPLDYADFEGVIPAGEYGGGTVMVWDRGTWTPATDPDAAYAKGRLKFQMHGEKLKGGWNLVRSRKRGAGGSEDSWLLFKEADEFARLGAAAAITEDRPASALTGRSIEDIAAQADRVWHSNRGAGPSSERAKAPRKRGVASSAAAAKLEGARKGTLPDTLDPQLATLMKVPPVGPRWVHEIKHDGYRMLGRLAGGEARMVSRTAKDWSIDFAPVARALAQLPVTSAWLDGEVVVVDEQGRSRFQALQNALSGTSRAALVYFAFDLLHIDGIDLRGVILGERKRLLKDLLSTAPATVRYSEHFDVPGSAFLENVRKLGLEGMISKRIDLAHRPGRGPAWIKVKCQRQQEMVIGGFTDPEGSREAFGALLLGVHEADGTLVYAGKVGTGFDAAALASVHHSLKALVRKTSPFANPPQGAEGRRAHWVEPVLVANVEFTEWTTDGTLRHPSFQGLRQDKPAKDVMRERSADPRDRDAPDPAPPARPPRKTAAAADAKNAKDAVAGIALSNPGKVLYPEARLSKRDLAAYYTAIAAWMLPHVRSRPLSLVRCPNGWDQKCFYQKNADDSVHAAISRVTVGNEDGIDVVYMMADSTAALVALVQMGVLEIHPWGSSAARLGQPDRLVFDLDPEETLPWDDVKQGAIVVKALMENLGLAPFLKSTGGKGLHVVVPVEPSAGWEDVKGFTRAVAELLERTFPDRFTAKLLKVSRRGRIFIDYLRNAEGATAVAAYSLRAKAHAPVSTPLHWDELAGDIRFAHFNATTVPRRLAKLGKDPWKGMGDRAVPLTAALMARVGYKAR